MARVGRNDGARERAAARAAADAQSHAHDEQALREVGQRFGAHFQLHDDLGTEYRAPVVPRAKTGGWRGVDVEAEHPVWGASAFVPAVPALARQLYARNGSDQITIELL